MKKGYRYVSALSEEAIWKDLEALAKENGSSWTLGKNAYLAYKTDAQPPYFSITKAVVNKNGVLYPVEAVGEISSSREKTQVSFQLKLSTTGYLSAGFLALFVVMWLFFLQTYRNNPDHSVMNWFILSWIALAWVFLIGYFFIYPLQSLKKQLQTRWQLTALSPTATS